MSTPERPERRDRSPYGIAARAAFEALELDALTAEIDAQIESIMAEAREAVSMLD